VSGFLFGILEEEEQIDIRVGQQHLPSVAAKWDDSDAIPRHALGHELLEAMLNDLIDQERSAPTHSKAMPRRFKFLPQSGKSGFVSFPDFTIGKNRGHKSRHEKISAG
jgi:hypothetical protein